jgi:hypothetical protein
MRLRSRRIRSIEREQFPVLQLQASLRGRDSMTNNVSFEEVLKDKCQAEMDIKSILNKFIERYPQCEILEVQLEEFYKSNYPQIDKVTMVVKI